MVYRGLKMADMFKPSQSCLRAPQAIKLCCNTNSHKRAASCRIACVRLGSEAREEGRKLIMPEERHKITDSPEIWFNK